MMSGGGYSALDDPKASGSVPAAAGPDPPAIRFTDSNLQTFPPSEARGKISGAYRPPTDADVLMIIWVRGIVIPSGTMGIPEDQVEVSGRIVHA
ncbi:hypothetical protein EJB05_47511, partial [Eragrostis curvula]